MRFLGGFDIFCVYRKTLKKFVLVVGAFAFMAMVVAKGLDEGKNKGKIGC